MDRERRGRRSSRRRGRRSDPRLRGLSYDERRRVYLRRRIVALVVIAVLLLSLVLLLTGLTPLFGSAKTDETSVENASSKLELEHSASNSSNREDVASNPGYGAQKTVEKVAAEPMAVESTGATGAEPLDVLVLGVDKRPDASFVEGSRSDTIMVARIMPETGEVRMLSIPRDLFVEIEPGVEDRINAAYSYGGVEQMSSAVEKSTGISVDHYAVVDFKGFKDIVNSVDGLTVEIQGEMPPGRHMEGTQTLNGKQALFYARYRGTPGGDLDRIAHQQQLVGALREKLVSWGTVSKLPEIMEAIHGNLETDMGLMTNISLARSLLNADDNSAFEAFQLAGSPTTLPDGRQVLVPDPSQNERILKEFREE